MDIVHTNFCCVLLNMPYSWKEVLVIITCGGLSPNWAFKNVGGIKI